MSVSDIPVVIFVGTRPEVIKMAPVCWALDNQSIPYHLVGIQQQPSLLSPHIKELGLESHQSIWIERSDSSLNELLAKELLAVQSFYASTQNHYRIALVHGDTTTALAAAIGSFHKDLVVGHVEAGLRTPSLYSPFPEEANRRLIDQLAKYHFAPTWNAVANVMQGIPEAQQRASHVYRTGNTGIDTLRRTLLKQPCPGVVKELVGDRRFALLTCHRRENWERIGSLTAALKRVPDYINIIWPLHPNPALARQIQAALDDHHNIRLIGPQSYTAMAHFIQRASLVITDSGGIIEEAADLEKATLILRDETERPEALDESCQLVPHTQWSTLPQRIVGIPTRRMSKGRFGDGTAGKQIAGVIETLL